MSRIDFFLFWFSLCLFFEKKKSDSVRNEFGLVRKNAVRFRYYSYLLLM